MSKGLERLKNKNLPCSNCKELKAIEILKEFVILEKYEKGNDEITMRVCECDCWDEQFKAKYDLLKEVLL